jgi:hypothetical protein
MCRAYGALGFASLTQTQSKEAVRGLDQQIAPMQSTEAMPQQIHQDESLLSPHCSESDSVN